MFAAMQSVEVGSAVDAKQNRFAVDHKRAATIAKGGFNDERIPVGPVMTVAGEKAHALCRPAEPAVGSHRVNFAEPFRAVGNFRRPGGMQGSKALVRMPKR